MPRVFIGIGSNLGDRAGYFELAYKEILSIQTVRDLQRSPVYETEPVGVGGGPFLNAVWSFETELTPQELLQKLQGIEIKTGRKRDRADGARTLDLDLLFYGDEMILEKDLIVPHPKLHERGFVIMPLSDLAPDWIHSAMKVPVKELKNRLGKFLGIKKIKI
jgi:2-amino-4-hydroxy-6-hydroxymethyldihydropteridine diphosphokinase